MISERSARSWTYIAENGALIYERKERNDYEPKKRENADRTSV
jgi:hypothetical protein